jgi:hypothetical protein
MRESVFRDWPLLLTAYLACGLLWTLWQSKSQFTQTLASKFQKAGRSWLFLIAWVVGALLWPLGPLGYLALSLWIRFGRNREL